MGYPVKNPSAKLTFLSSYLISYEVFSKMKYLHLFQSYPTKCSQPQLAEFQTEVLCAQIDYFLGGNLLSNPSAGPGNHGKIVANAFTFASKVVDKLWVGK